MAGADVTWLNWLIRFNDVGQLWKAQPTYLISQTVYMLAGILTLIHSFRKGGRWPYFWLATVLHGIYADNFWHFVVPEYDNFWHSQTPVMLFGGRTPLHIFLLYPVFIYHAAYAISKLDLPKYAEPFAVSLVVVLLDLPYDVVAVRFVHWTWHDTDPNIFDRHYWVPWNSYYFHATFTASLYFFFHYFKNWFAKENDAWKSSGVAAELKALFLAVLVGMPGGVLLFVSIYHPLHDNYGIHAEVSFFLLLSIFVSIVFLGLVNRQKKSSEKLTAIDYAMVFQLAVHFIIYWVFVVFFNPESEVSTGLHEPVGPCNEQASMVSPIGNTLYKRKYFCLEDYDEGYFDFHCVGNKKPANGATWYTICGTRFTERAEYIVILSVIQVVAAIVFYALYFRTQPEEPQTLKKKLKSK